MESNVAKLNRLAVATHPSGPRDKVRTLAEVGQIAAQLRAAGKIVVQAHGAFDLLHLGHVRHLEAARRLGDVLMVTVTADRFVNKGPGRPVFEAALRAEMLANLEYVDWVAVNDAPDAIHAIDCIRPSVYVKGQDYRNPNDDITGKIGLEQQACEVHGGRIHFTDEAVFSSTKLINRHLDIFEPHIRRYLEGLRSDGGLRGMLDLIERVRDYRVLVVGDAIVDEYQYVSPMQKTPKENMIATRYRDRELFAGGVFATANHIASFCKQVDVVTCLGDTDRHEDLIRQALKPNVGLHTFTNPGSPTTLKRRFVDVASMRKLFEVYVMNDEPLPNRVQDDVDGAIADLASGYDVVIAADFGHGLIARSSIGALTEHARFLAVNAQSNSANLGYNLISRYGRADYVCIDMPEARLALGDRRAPAADIARRIVEDCIDCPRIIVTQGKEGCVALERGSSAHEIPAFGTSVVDTIGAGDAFLSVTAPLVAAGGSVSQVGFIGNIAGALKVEIVGHRRSIEKVDVVRGIASLLK